MKKFTVLIAAALMSAAMALSALTVSAADYTLEITNSDIADDGSITATISITENSRLYSGSFSFYYNSSSFELGEITVNQSGTNGKITYDTETDGLVKFTYRANDDNGCVYGGEFAELSMRLTSTPDSILSFNLDDADMTDPDGNELEAAFKITPIEVPSSFIVTEAATDSEAETQAAVTPETAKTVEDKTSGGFWSTLWTIIKTLFFILLILVVLLLVISFFTRRYFKKKRRLEREKKAERKP